MSTLIEQLNHEPQFNSAAAAILTAAGFTVATPGSTTTLLDRHTRVRFTVGAPTGGAATAGNGIRFDTSFAGELSVDHYAPPPESGVITDAFTDEAGRTRAALHAPVLPFNETNLPLLYVSSITPLGSSYGIDPLDRYVFSLRFGIEFEIRAP